MMTKTTKYWLLFAGLTISIACASDPPPPPQPPPPAPAAETPPPPPPAEAEATPVVENTPAAAEPECQVADDCKKVREPSAGMQWACENTQCVEQTLPEPPAAEATAEADKAEKTSKRTPKGKAKKK